MILRTGLAGWWDFTIRERVSHDNQHGPVTFANDANAAAYGEFWSGAVLKQYSQPRLYSQRRGRRDPVSAIR